MKICVLVKEVPDAAVEKRIDPSTGRMDRSGEKNLNPYDTHAIEAAMQIREGGAVPVEEIVAVTMGPESAVRALHKAVSLGADRSVPSAVLVALVDEDGRAASDALATQLRAHGVPCEVAPAAQKFGKQIRYAERRGIPYVLFPGADGSAPEVKDIRSGDQQPVDPATWAPPEPDLAPTITTAVTSTTERTESP